MRGVENAIDVMLHVALMIGERDAAGHVQARTFKPGNELVGPRDATEGNHRAFDSWNLHAAMKAPDRALPKTAAA